MTDSSLNIQFILFRYSQTEKKEEFEAPQTYIPFLHNTKTSVRTLPQHDSSCSRICRLACHSLLYRLSQPEHNHNQNSRSVSDASSALLQEYIHCWILARRKTQTRVQVNKHIHLYSVPFKQPSLWMFCDLQGTPSGSTIVYFPKASMCPQELTEARGPRRAVPWCCPGLVWPLVSLMKKKLHKCDLLENLPSRITSYVPTDCAKSPPNPK